MPCFVCEYLVGTLAWLLKSGCWDWNCASSIPFRTRPFLLEICYSAFDSIPFGIRLFLLKICHSAFGLIFEIKLFLMNFCWYLSCRLFRFLQKWDLTYLHSLRLSACQGPWLILCSETAVPPNVHFKLNELNWPKIIQKTNGQDGEPSNFPSLLFLKPNWKTIVVKLSKLNWTPTLISI